VPYQYAGGSTYNYYTYNYADSQQAAPDSPPSYTPAPPPESTTLADECFEAGVKAFAEGNYTMAVRQFGLAAMEADDDKIIPFAYAQALFASGDYASAARILRGAVSRVKPVEEGVFYPRGLYTSDDILFKQIETLAAKAKEEPQNANLQLLLGYHYLGLGEHEKAAEPLSIASQDQFNGQTARSLLQLLDKLRIDALQTAPAPKAPQVTKPEA